MTNKITGAAVLPAAPATLRRLSRRPPSRHLLGGGPADGVYMMLSTLAMIGLVAYRRDVYSMPLRGRGRKLGP
jgi:hypothetical protein